MLQMRCCFRNQSLIFSKIVKNLHILPVVPGAIQCAQHFPSPSSVCSNQRSISVLYPSLTGKFQFRNIANHSTTSDKQPQFSRHPNRTVKKQQSPSTPKLIFPIGEQGNLETKLFRGLDEGGGQLLKIKFEQGKSGEKYFHINKWDREFNKNEIFPKILSPEDAFSFVRAMDQLVEQLRAENWHDEKLLAKALPSSPSNDGNQMGVACSKVKGIRYDYQLDLFLFNNGRGRNKIGFQMQTIQSMQQHKGGSLKLPFRALPWLRHEMADILARHDGSQQLGAAPQIPPHLLREK